MKTVKIFSLALAVIALTVSCKSDIEKTSKKENLKNQKIALVETPSNENATHANKSYKYVIASTGLSLREFNNLSSEKLSVMPYGTRVKVITPETKTTMTVGGIKGGMDEVAFNHKKGYAFNGYLSNYFPPDEDVSIKGYAEELQTLFPKVTYTKTVGKSVRKPSTTETITLPEADWNEAFFIAKKLGNIPAYFAFPSVKGKENQILVEPESKEKPWTSELRITRENKDFKTIKYYYKNKNVTSIITLVKEGTAMKISKTEIIE